MFCATWPFISIRIGTSQLKVETRRHSYKHPDNAKTLKPVTCHLSYNEGQKADTSLLTNCRWCWASAERKLRFKDGHEACTKWEVYSCFG